MFKDKKAFPTLLSRLMGKAFISSLNALDERIFCHAQSGAIFGEYYEN